MSQHGVHPTILSAFHDAVPRDSLAGDGLHLFSSAAEKDVSSLRSLLDAISNVSRLVNSYSTMQVQNSKTVSMLRQHASNLQSLYTIKTDVDAFLSVPSKRPAGAYGEDIPLDTEAFGDWFVSRISHWGLEAKMEVFSEPETDGKRSVALGGKVLVLDIEITVRPCVFEPNVRVSFAVPGEANQPIERSTSLGRILGGVLQPFVLEAKKGAAAEPMVVAKMGHRVQDGLRYLMELDRLAEKEGDTGVRWFQEVDTLDALLDGILKIECNSVRQAEGQQTASLDILLRRSHALPLPYLLSPAISFLFSVSPSAYLALRKGSHPSDASDALVLDVPVQQLRHHLSRRTQHPGIYLATLGLLPSSTMIRPPPTPGISLSARPSFFLAPEASVLDHAFPVPIAESGSNHGYAWYIDFTSGGQTSGVVVTQSRMREIECVVNPIGGLAHVGESSAALFGNNSWLDMLLNPSGHGSPERYSAVYTSPTQKHPPLELRMGGMQEPGFILERVQVYNMRETWAVMEIIREQCWLNESLKSCPWGVNTSYTVALDSEDDVNVTEDELNAILSGTFMPRSIPVTVFVPTYSPPSSSSIFDSSPASSAHSRTSVVLTFPERPPITGLVEVSVVFDVTRSRGVAVEVRGAMGADIKIDDLEESVRRGGLFGIPGRIWSMTQGSS